MLYLPNYASAFRCVGQELERRGIEVFELLSHADEFRLQYGDPDPPYTSVIEIEISTAKIQILDREGQARRSTSDTEVRFDSIPEMLRAAGNYIDHKRVRLCRIGNSGSSIDNPALEVEYQTREGDIELEILTMSVLREASVRMYKKRSRLPETVNTLTRKR